MNDKKIYDRATVRVLRSHDYCHFEVQLGTDGEISDADVDELRKRAARLADKAVEQYKIAKKRATQLESLQHGYLKSRVDRITETPEADRSPEDKATLKAFQDAMHKASLVYDYEDDWRDDEE